MLAIDLAIAAQLRAGVAAAETIGAKRGVVSVGRHPGAVPEQIRADLEINAWLAAVEITEDAAMIEGIAALFGVDADALARSPLGAGGPGRGRWPSGSTSAGSAGATRTT